MNWSVYVLLSSDGKRTYVGVSTDVVRRLEQHNGLQPGGAKGTRAGQPWTVASTFGPFEDRSAAQKVEAQVKRLKGRKRMRWVPDTFG